MCSGLGGHEVNASGMSLLRLRPCVFSFVALLTVAELGHTEDTFDSFTQNKESGAGTFKEGCACCAVALAPLQQTSRVSCCPMTRPWPSLFWPASVSASVPPGTERAGTSKSMNFPSILDDYEFYHATPLLPFAARPVRGVRTFRQQLVAHIITGQGQGLGEQASPSVVHRSVDATRLRDESPRCCLAQPLNR